MGLPGRMIKGSLQRAATVQTRARKWRQQWWSSRVMSCINTPTTLWPPARSMSTGSVYPTVANPVCYQGLLLARTSPLTTVRAMEIQIG